MLLDTGRKKNNVTVWRIPGYENWLRRQNESPDKNGRASETDARALAQVAELTKEKTLDTDTKLKPPHKGEGSSQAPPFLQSGPPISAPEALPKTGGNLKDLDLPVSEGARATGAPPFDEEASRQYWTNFVVHLVLGCASALGISRLKPQFFADVPLYHREHLQALSRELIDEAIGAERYWHPLKPFARRRLEAQIDSRIGAAMRVLRPPTPSEAAAIAAAN